MNNESAIQKMKWDISIINEPVIKLSKLFVCASHLAFESALI